MNALTPNYSSFFYLNPLPSWISDNETLEILDVNIAAINHYGYSREEFLSLTLKDLRPPEEMANFIRANTDIKSREGNIYLGIFTHQKKNGTLIKMDINGHNVDFQNRQCLLVICQDVTEKIEQEEKILQSEQRFKALVQEGADLIAILDAEGNYLYVSPTSISVLGIAPEEFIGRSPFEFIHPDDAEKVSSSLEKIATEKKVLINPFRFRNKNKDWRWIETVLTNMTDNPAVNGIVANSRDITDKIEQREKFEQSQKRFKSLVDNSMDCTIIITAEGKSSYVSGSIKNILGYTPDEAMKIDFRDLVHPEDLPGAENALTLSLEQPGVAMKGYNSRIKHKNGSWRWVEPVITNLLHDPSVEGIVDNFRDITDQVEEQHKLKLLESVITNTHDAIVITEAEPQGEPGPRILYVNEAFTKMTGYSSEEVIGKSPRLLQGPNTDRKELDRLGKALRNWEPCEVTVVNYKKNGEEFWINFSVTPVANDKGWYTHWISIERDVTEQKQKELEKELLGKISMNFSFENDLLDAAIALCRTLNDYGHFDFVELWLPTLDETHIQLFAHEPASPKADTFYERSKEVKSFEKGKGLPGVVWAKNDTIFWNEINKKDDLVRIKAAQSAGLASAMGLPLVFNEKTVGVLLIATHGELNHLKKYAVLFEHLRQFLGSEISRKKLENDLQHLYNAIPDIICITDLQGRFLKINKAGCDLIGSTEEEILYNTFEKFVHPDDKESSHKDLENLKKGGKTFGFENRYINKNGHIIWLSWTSNSNIQEGLIYATARNITEEKRLRELNRQAGILSKIGSWEVDLVNSTAYWSEMTHQIHETDSNSYLPNLKDGIDFFREDFRPMIYALIERSTTTGEAFDLEAVLITANKNEKWVRAIGHSEMVEGKCQRIYGSFQDIHQRKLSEIALKESEAKFRTIFDIASLGIIQVNPTNGRIILANSYYETITGYSIEEMMAMNFLDLTHPDDREKDWELFSKAARGEVEYRNEKRYVKKNGTIVWVRIHLAFIKDAKGKPIRTVAICENITERKEAESRLKDLSDNIPGVVFQYLLHPDGTDALRYVSKGAEKIWGYSPELISKDNDLVWNQIKAAGDFELVRQSIKESVENKSQWSIRFRSIPTDGEVCILQGLGSPQFLADGIVQFNSVVLDVTQEAKNEELLELATELAKIGSWEIDVVGNKLFWSDKTHELHDTDPNSFQPDLETGINFYREDFRAMVNEEVAKCIENGIPFDFEAVIITAKENERWIRAIGHAEMIDGKCQRIYGSFQDIHQQKLNEIALQRSIKELEDYKFSLDQSAIIAITDAKGVITSVNENFCKISGYTQEELIGKTHQIINSKHHPKAFFVDLWKTIASGKVWRGEVKNLAKDGAFYWVDTTIVPFLNEKNKPLQYLAIRFDITSRKKSEEEKNSLLETLETSLNEIYIFDSETLQFSYVNKGALLNLGYSEHEIKTLTPLDLKPDYTVTSFQQLVAPLVNNDKEKIVFFTSHKRKNGSLYAVEVHLQLVIEGKNKRFLAIILDITDRKKAEEELLKAYEEKDNILESISDAFYGLDKNWNITYFNKEAENLLKRKSENVLGKNLWEEFSPAKGTLLEEKYRSVAKTGKPETFEYWYPGDESWYELNAYPSKGGISAFFKNIDDRKKAAADLQKAHEEKNNILESIGDAFFAVDKNWIVTYWNKEAENLVGRKRDNLIGKDLWDLFPDVIGKDFYDQYQIAMKAGKTVNFEKHHPTLNKWFETAAYPSEKGLSVYFKDVTLRKETDEQLLEAYEEKNKILESIGDAFFAVDKNWIVTYWNKEAETVLGRKREEIVGENLWEKYNDAIDSDFYRQYHKAMETGKIVDFEEYYPTLNKWFEVAAYPSEKGLSVYFKDVTLRKEADIRLLQANERFEIVTEATNDAIWDYDVVNNKLFWGKGFLSLFGHNPDEITPTFDLLLSFIHEDDKERIVNQVNRYMSDPTLKDWYQEFRFLKADNTYAIVIDRATFIRNNKGTVERVIGAMNDITDRKNFEQQLLSLNESLDSYAKDLERSNEELESFAFITSHDLQEPLRMITSFMDQLKRKYGDQMDEKALQYIHFATDGAKRMKHIILDLLEYSRAGRPIETMEEVDINQILSDFKQLRRKVILEKSATISNTKLPTIFSSKVAVSQVFHSLLDNAIKYSKEGIAPHIELTATEKKEEWKFTIKDNGIGIDPEFYDKIFIIFQRLHNRSEYDGTGIGLSIAKKHIEFLGGEIWVDSTPGEGATFNFTIPKTR